MIDERKKAMIRSVTICLAFVVLGTTARAGTTHHVYSGESIQAAINGAASGDEIIVHPGTSSSLKNRAAAQRARCRAIVLAG